MISLTTGEFICRAKTVHGSLYDYSNTEYLGAGTKVSILCNDHGAFLQLPSNHLSGNGCPACGKRKVKTSLEAFVAKASEVHSNYYDYSRTEYAGSSQRVCVTCPEHGDFFVFPGNHLRGSKCKKCATRVIADKGRLTTEEFISRGVALHGDKFSYNEASYTGKRDRVTITCSCGTTFAVLPGTHLCRRGRGGCPVCKVANSAKASTYAFSEFVDRARKVHGDRYVYMESGYSLSSRKVSIECPSHGIFSQQGTSHLAGAGCPGCWREQVGRAKFARAKENAVAAAIGVHGDRYDYSKFVYAGRHEKSLIVCRTHGEFLQEFGSHLLGGGCPECGKEAARQGIAVSFEEFVERARKVHGEGYTYLPETYVNLTTKCEIGCKKHGSFWQTPKDHVDGHHCSKCSGAATSRGQEEVAEFIAALGLACRQRVCGVLGDRKELDILVDSVGLAIEFNGLYWHSERTGRGQHYHQSKTDTAAEAGYDLIHLTDLQWRDHQEAVKSLLAARCGMELEKLDARKCRIVSPPTAEMRRFLNKSHIQGYRSGNLYLGLEHRGVLVAVASFGLSKAKDAELQRYATLPGTRVRGGLGRLVAHWRRGNPGVDLISFCDTAYFDGHSYNAVGFRQEGVLAPDYGYTDGVSYYSKEAFRRTKQQRSFENYDPSLTEKENAARNGWYRIWGCNKLKFRLAA